MIHGSYPNTSTDRFRRAFICHYIAHSSVECSHYYFPLCNFAGEIVERGKSTSGGPCGSAQSSVKGPH